MRGCECILSISLPFWGVETCKEGNTNIEILNPEQYSFYTANQNKKKKKKTRNPKKFNHNRQREKLI